ncbi:MAG: WD40 repeat domain-containing protein [Treponema sp.]|nr:WD40 repeat domain-containing protein [Treponema sp.]
MKGKMNVKAAIYTLDGKFLITGVGNKNAYIAKYDAGSGKRLQKFEETKNTGINKFLLSQDGREILVDCLYQGEDYIYDIESGKLLYTLPGNDLYYVTSDGFRGIVSAWSPDNGSYTITVKDPASGSVIKTEMIPNVGTGWKQYGGHYVSQDGRKYAAVGYILPNEPSTYVLYYADLENIVPDTPVITPILSPYVEDLNTVAFSPDGKYLAVGFTRSVLSKGEVEKSLKEKRGKERERFLYNYFNDDGEVNRETRIRIFGLDMGDDMVGEYHDTKFNDTVYYVTPTRFNMRIQSLQFTRDGKTLYGVASPGLAVGTLRNDGKWNFREENPKVGKRTFGYLFTGNYADRYFLCLTHDEKQMLLAAREESVFSSVYAHRENAIKGKGIWFVDLE